MKRVASRMGKVEVEWGGPGDEYSAKDLGTERW